MKRTVALLMALGLLLTACSQSDGGETTAELTFQDAGGDATDISAPGEVEVDFEVDDGRQVIRRASLELQAGDTRRTFDDIVEMVRSMGGFVADAHVFPTTSSDAQPQVSMTLRIPSDRLDAAMTAIKESADEVVSETQGAEDVTEQFIDLEARLRNLEALEVELRTLLTEVRQRENAEPDEILRVFNEVSSVRGQIEQLQGQIDYLDDLTSLATLSVTLTQTPSAAPLVDEPWDPGATVKDAVGNLVEGLQGVADWAITFALYALPMLILVVGPLALVGLLVYRRFSSRAPEDPAPNAG